MGKMCMVEGCNKEATHYVNDGVFLIKCCSEHEMEFRIFARDNGRTFYSEKLIFFEHNKESKETTQ